MAESMWAIPPEWAEFFERFPHQMQAKPGTERDDLYFWCRTRFGRPHVVGKDREDDGGRWMEMKGGTVSFRLIDDALDFKLAWC